MSTIQSGITTTIENAVEGPAQALAEKEIAALCTKLGITDPNAVSYFQAAADNVVKGLALSAEPLLTKAVSYGVGLLNKLFTPATVTAPTKVV